MQFAVHTLSRMRTIAGAFLPVGLAALVAASWTSALATSSSGEMSDRVSVELRGRVMPRCNFSGDDAFLTAGNAGSLAGIVSVRRVFQVDCNAPFTVSLSSTYGGLQHGEGAVFPYRSSLKIVTDSGRTVSLDCEASALKAGSGDCSASSSEDTAIGREAILTLNWEAPEDAAAGTYTDDLRLSFAVQD